MHHEDDKRLKNYNTIAYIYLRYLAIYFQMLKLQRCFLVKFWDAVPQCIKKKYEHWSHTAVFFLDWLWPILPISMEKETSIFYVWHWALSCLVSRPPMSCVHIVKGPGDLNSPGSTKHPRVPPRTDHHRRRRKLPNRASSTPPRGPGWQPRGARSRPSQRRRGPDPRGHPASEVVPRDS